MAAAVLAVVVAGSSSCSIDINPPAPVATIGE
jgi:hypothetical protein